MIEPDENSYLIVVHRAGGNFSAHAPDVPGCIATGDTVAECEREMRSALAFHFEGVREDGDPLPEPTVAAASFVPAA